MATVTIEQPFAVAEAAAALATEAVFVSRYAQLMLRHDALGVFIIFRNGEYRTSKPHEIEFLLGVVKDEERGNRGVQVRSLPTAPVPTISDAGAFVTAAPQADRAEPVAATNTGSPASVPTPQRRRRGPDRAPRRSPRKRGS
jgi:hypothetical protein